ncbi:MAG: hypothetical protein R3F28_03310 [Candidatus Kapaibacterium sp.]
MSTVVSAGEHHAGVASSLLDGRDAEGKVVREEELSVDGHGRVADSTTGRVEWRVPHSFDERHGSVDADVDGTGSGVR